MNLKAIGQCLKNASHVLISAHTNPDGDAIGAMVATGLLCAQCGVNYTLLLEEEVARFHYLLEGMPIASEVVGPIDTMIALDCGDTKRLIGYEAYFTKAKTTLLVDHHITNEYYAAHNYVVPEASSTCELIYDLIVSMEVPFTKAMAVALYTGMVTDTGGFMHSCTSPTTMRKCATLMEESFDFSSLYHKLLHEKSLTTLKLQSVAIDHLSCIKPGVYLSYMTQGDLDEIGATKEHVDGIVSFLKSMEGTEVIGFIYPLPKESGYKLSTRSNAPYNVAAFCQQFGGGGHERAAGAMFGETLTIVREKVAEALRQLEGK